MAKKKHQWQAPNVVYQPQVRRGIQNGANRLVDAIALTLGPLPRLVVNENIMRSERPEFLDDGALIARRMLMLHERNEDVGAMYLRQMLCQVSELVGDGTATAAVLFQSIFNHGIRYLAAGGNAMLLRRHLENAVQPMLDTLDGMAVGIDTPHQLQGLARSVCHDEALAQALADALSTIGEYGRLEIRSGHGREIESEYAEGTYWDSGLVKRYGSGPANKITLANIPLLITDFDVQDSRQLLPLFNLALREGLKQVVVMVASISDIAQTVLSMPDNRDRVEFILVKAPLVPNSSTREVLHDLALLTGARAFIADAGWTLDNIQLDDLGWARRFWADATYFGVIGGQGDSRLLRQHISRLKQTHQESDDHEVRSRLQARLNKLISGTTVLWIGSISTIDVESRRDHAKNAAETVRSALREGVIPGGGVGLKQCIPAVQEKVHLVDDPDERAAYHILGQALEAPFRTVLRNAGCSPDFVMVQMSQCPATYGFDVVRGEVVDMMQAGIVDPVSVIKTALRSAVHAAALALTIDTIVHRANPPEAVHP